MNGLNGWQRIWVVLMVMWTLFIGFVGYSRMPTSVYHYINPSDKPLAAKMDAYVRARMMTPAWEGEDCDGPITFGSLFEEVKDLAKLRAVLDSSIDKIAEEAYEASIYLTFYGDNDYSEIIDSEISDLSITDMRIVALGEHECTVAFDAVVRAAHQVRWFEPSGPEGEMEQTGETVKRDYDVSGTAKVSLDAKTNALLDVPSVTLNEEEIEAGDMPPFWNRWR
jgi:hypothetical protein